MYAKDKLDLSLKLDSEEMYQQIRDNIDFEKLGEMTREVVRNLNQIIDKNYYPLDKYKDGELKQKTIHKTNLKHRPIGVGVSGFAEFLHILDLPFEHPITFLVNKILFACIYYNALLESVSLAIKFGKYDSFDGSPFSQGKLQFDLWKEEFKILGPNKDRKEEDDQEIDPVYWGQSSFDVGDHIVSPNWDSLKKTIQKFGTRNSLLLALMPTASTAQIRRNCESVEAHQNNIYSRKVLKCNYPVINRFLIYDLDELHLWNLNTIEYIKFKSGSIKGLCEYILSHKEKYPNGVFDVQRIQHLEKKYKTMWEISQKAMIRLAADRSRYIDQSSSMNIYFKDCTDDKLRSCHLYSNAVGLKTIIYYLRQTGEETIKFTADTQLLQELKMLEVEKEEGLSLVEANKKMKCNDTVCLSCS